MIRSGGWKLRISRIYDDHFLHHATILMIENVAVELEGAWKIQEPMPNPHAARGDHCSNGLGWWNRNGIPPVVWRLQRSLRRGVGIENFKYLERIDVDVERVHGAVPVVFERPLLGRVQHDHLIRRAIEGLPIDGRSTGAVAIELESAFALDRVAWIVLVPLQPGWH